MISFITVDAIHRPLGVRCVRVMFPLPFLSPPHSGRKPRPCGVHVGVTSDPPLIFFLGGGYKLPGAKLALLVANFRWRRLLGSVQARLAGFLIARLTFLANFFRFVVDLGKILGLKGVGGMAEPVKLQQAVQRVLCHPP